jgi:hypothetical protein
MTRWLRLIPIGFAALLLLSATTLISDLDSQAVPLSGPDGVIETFASSQDGIANPHSVAITADGNVYVASFATIHRFSGDTITTVTGVEDGVGAIASDPYGNAYAVSYTGCGLYGLLGDVAVEEADICDAFDTSLHEVEALAIDAYGNVYFTEGRRCSVYRLEPTGNITLYAGRGHAGAIHCFHGSDGAAVAHDMGRPMSLAVDPNSGMLYVGIERELSDPSRVRRISSSGMMSTVAGGVCCELGDGGPATNATLGNFPGGLIVDEYGDIYIAAFSFEEDCRVRRITGGIIDTIAGTGACGSSGDGVAAVEAELDWPQGITLDTNGTLYIADRNSHRIRVVYGMSRDSDDDGFSDAHEERLGKDPHSYCNAMRADVNGDGAVNIQDISLVSAHFGKPVPPGPPRYRQGPPPFGTHINIQDLSKIGMVYAQTIAVCD